MKIEIFQDKQLIGRTAAHEGAKVLRTALAEKPEIAMIVATGVSQFEMLDVLIGLEGIDWSRVTMFHLDEYIGLPGTHPASFRYYLHERLVRHIPNLKAFIDVNANALDLAAELARLNMLISRFEVDLCFAGIGENGHLAFNDPPADFDTRDPYIVVNLDEVCRYQQLKQGWFPTLEDVPKTAVSMSIQEIMRAKKIILIATDLRKADAIKGCLEGPVINTCPASILQKHPDCTIFLDENAASKLAKRPG